MEKVTELFYDAEGDVLYLSIGKPQRAVSQEVGDDILLRVDADTGDVVGLTILNLASRFGALQTPQTLPIEIAVRKAG